MLKEEASVIVDRPIEEVFAYVSDLRHCAEWQVGVAEVRKTSEGPLGIGTTFRFVREFLGRKMEATTEFVGYEPNTGCTFRAVSDSMPGESTYLFESTPTGTKVTSMVAMSPRGLARLATPLIAMGLRRGMESGLRELKDLLERR
jgi:uncharacterized protein YndB with AHSA1/START domain